MKYALTALLCLSCLASAAFADVVHLKNGRKLEGETRWTKKGELEVKLKYGTVRYKRADVLKVVKKETPKQEYARRLRDLDPTDLKATLALGTFAAKHKGIEAKAAPLLLDVVKQARARAAKAKATDPQTEASQQELKRMRSLLTRAADALRDLDYHEVKGRWLAPAEYYPSRGYVKVGTRWIKKTKLDLRNASRDKRAAKKDAKSAQRDLKRSERGLKGATKAYYAAQKAYAKSKARVKHYKAEVKRLTGEVTSAEHKLIALETEETKTHRLWIVARANHAAWEKTPCKCSSRCACGWDRKRKALLLITSDLDKVLWNTRAKIKQAKKALKALKNGKYNATRLLARARKTLARSKAELAVADANLSEARRKAREAEAKLGGREEDLKDAKKKLDDAKQNQ